MKKQGLEEKGEKEDCSTKSPSSSKKISKRKAAKKKMLKIVKSGETQRRRRQEEQEDPKRQPKKRTLCTSYQSIYLSHFFSQKPFIFSLKKHCAC